MISTLFSLGDYTWFFNEVDTPYGVGVRKGIRKGWDLFRRFISFDIGNGASVKFNFGKTSGVGIQSCGELILLSLILWPTKKCLLVLSWL